MGDDANSHGEPKSKSQLKRDMLALQALGQELVQLPAAQLRLIPLDSFLIEAIQMARSITSHGGHRRQLQYIGRLMRAIDPEPIQQALALIHRQSQQNNATFHQLEHWRNRLIKQGDDAISDLLATFPQADRQHLRQLIRGAQKEQGLGQATQQQRQLFRYLRELLEFT